MIRSSVRTLIIGISSFALGVGLMLSLSHDDVAMPLACRPSVPQALSSEASILLLGNSLAFDADWQTDMGQAVNCARQGLTVAAALPLIEDLPDITPKAIVLVFGTVELVRGTADPEVFQAHMSTLIDTLNAKYTNAPLIALSVPTIAAGWSYDLADAQALNTIIAGFEDVSMLPLNPILARYDGPVSYDDVHLTPSVYPLIRTALETHLAFVLRTTGQK